MTMRRAVDMKVTIKGVLFSVQEFTFDDVCPLDDVSNTNGVTGNPAYGPSPGFASKLPDIKNGRVSLRMATFDDAENPFAAGGLNIGAGSFVPILAYPAGLTGVKWTMSNVAIAQMSNSGHVPGVQPISLQGETDGLYLTPFA
jgi:hypothetical protein